MNRALRCGLPCALLPVMFILGIVALSLDTSETGWSAVWPVGLATGILLLSVHRAQPVMGVAITAVAAGTFLIGGAAPGVALGYGIGITLEATSIRFVLTGRPWWKSADHPALARVGEPLQLSAAVVAGGVVGSVIFSLTAVLAGAEDWWAIGLASLITHTISQGMMLNLFRPSMPPPRNGRGRTERDLVWIVTVVVTVVTMSATTNPLPALLIIPLLGWMTFSASTREATVLLSTVAVISAWLTIQGYGPFAQPRIVGEVAPQFVMLPYMIFLGVCTLVVVPFSVAVARQRENAELARHHQVRSDLIVQSTVGIALIGTDEAGRVNAFGPGAEAILGYPAAEVLGRSPEMFHTEDEIRRHAEALGTEPTYQAVLEACGELPRGTARNWAFRRRDGECRMLSTIITRILDADGRPRGYLATADDVTDRLAATAALEQALLAERTAVRQLREVDATKDAFISTVSHELRTPITNIVGYLELLQDGSFGEASPLQENALGRIDGNAHRLLMLIDDLLALSASTAPAIPARTEVALGPVVGRALEATTASAARRRLDLSADIPATPVEVLGNGHDLERLLINLLTNAVKFTPDGGAVSVRVRPGEDECGPVLEVADTGIGIGELDQKKLFTRFYRTEQAREQAIPGTGLGLAIVKAIAQQHAADIAVDSTPGAGTTFRLTFPPARRLAETA